MLYTNIQQHPVMCQRSHFNQSVTSLQNLLDIEHHRGCRELILDVVKCEWFSWWKKKKTHCTTIWFQL